MADSRPRCKGHEVEGEHVDCGKPITPGSTTGQCTRCFSIGRRKSASEQTKWVRHVILLAPEESETLKKAARDRDVPVSVFLRTLLRVALSDSTEQVLKK